MFALDCRYADEHKKKGARTLLLPEMAEWSKHESFCGSDASRCAISLPRVLCHESSATSPLP